jgi:hypothetical protein
MPKSTGLVHGYSVRQLDTYDMLPQFLGLNSQFVRVQSR